MCAESPRMSLFRSHLSPKFLCETHTFPRTLRKPFGVYVCVCVYIKVSLVAEANDTAHPQPLALNVKRHFVHGEIATLSCEVSLNYCDDLKQHSNCRLARRPFAVTHHIRLGKEKCFLNTCHGSLFHPPETLIKISSSGCNCGSLDNKICQERQAQTSPSFMNKPI